MADDYVRMACAEVKKIKLPQGNPNAASNKRILVVGGGVSGMTAALAAADAGYKVVLVEKDAELGGWAKKLWKRVPFKGPFAEPQDTGAAELGAKVAAHANITVHLDSTVAETAGAPGRFAVRIAQASGGEIKEDVGAIVQASGFTTYDIHKLASLGGGQPNVVDQAGLEAMAQKAPGGSLRACRRKGGQIRRVHPVRGTSATRAAPTSPIAPATAARPASNRRCISRMRTRDRHCRDVHGPAHAGHGRGFLSQRAA